MNTLQTVSAVSQSLVAGQTQRGAVLGQSDAQWLGNLLGIADVQWLGNLLGITDVQWLGNVLGQADVQWLGNVLGDGRVGDGASVGKSQRSSVLSVGERLGMLSDGDRLSMLSDGDRSGVLSVGDRLSVLSDGDWRSMSNSDRGGVRDGDLLWVDGSLTLDDGVESVVRVGGVGHGATVTVGFDERVLALDGVSVAGLLLFLDVAGVRVVDGVREIVLSRGVLLNDVRGSDSQGLSVLRRQESCACDGSE